jgi:hypothetical protein
MSETTDMKLSLTGVPLERLSINSIYIAKIKSDSVAQVRQPRDSSGGIPT